MRHSHICNDNGLFIPYTYPTMALDAPLTIERKEGKTPGTTIIQLTGPVTLLNLFDLQAQLRTGELPRLSILDLSGVPYMDSSGMGAIINYYVRCQNNGVKLIVAGISDRVLELFKLTKVDVLIAQAATIEEAEAKE
jgi:anti-sigma B factor antagonist